MTKTTRTDMIIGIFFVSVLGTFAHFFYEWSGNNRLIALICPVNESTWEHMKLLFFPMLLYTFFPGKKRIYEYMKKASKNIVSSSAMLFGNLFGSFLIPVFFYTYSGILGYNITWIDIAIFYLCVILAFLFAGWMNTRETGRFCRSLLFGVVLLFLIFFFVFSFYPPDIALFQG